MKEKMKEELKNTNHGTETFKEPLLKPHPNREDVWEAAPGPGF
jgi:hypothetical protein